MKPKNDVAGNDKKNVIRICSSCHRIIDKRQTLARIEACAKECTGVRFSHGLCPKCFHSEMAKIEADTFEKTKFQY